MALKYSFFEKNVLVTGGASGIGRQLVERFHDDGAKVFTIDKNAEAIEELKKALPNVTAVVLDLNDWEETRRVVESFGVLDHLVNNAATVVMEPFLEISNKAILAQFNVLFAAVINVSQVMAKSLIVAGRGGSIVNISSIAARTGASAEAGLGVYGAAKAGVENLTKSMAIELGTHDIRVNCLSPGIVETPIMRSHLDGKELEGYFGKFMQRMVIKRPINPNEIADLAMFLLSPLSRMIVGETVTIDGGIMTS